MKHLLYSLKPNIKPQLRICITQTGPIDFEDLGAEEEEEVDDVLILDNILDLHILSLRLERKKMDQSG